MNDFVAEVGEMLDTQLSMYEAQGRVPVCVAGREDPLRQWLRRGGWVGQCLMLSLAVRQGLDGAPRAGLRRDCRARCVCVLEAGELVRK